MSDSDVNTGNQDVLLSVKRLVDEEAHGESEFDFIPTAPAPKLDRLVLMDALRVSDESLILEKPMPLKPMPLKPMPQKSTREGSSAEAANASKSPAAELLRLQPGDVVREGNADAKVKALEAALRRDLAGSLSAKMEALEAAVVETEDQWEPDGESDDAYSDTKAKAVEWPIENGIARSQTGETKSQSDSVATFISDSEVARGQAGKSTTLNLSEEELREMVARIVREELQGALGEGISRKLRKMVRREIARAVTAKGAV